MALKGRETLGFVWSNHNDTMPLYTPWRVADHLCLAMADFFGGDDEVAVLPGLGDFSAAHCLA